MKPPFDCGALTRKLSGAAAVCRVRCSAWLGGASIVTRHVARKTDSPNPLLSWNEAHLHG